MGGPKCIRGATAGNKPALGKDIGAPVRFGGGDDETRVVVELSSELEFRAFTVSEPTRRLVLDISRATWSVDGLETGEGLGYGLVDDFRFFDRSAEASRLVFELESPAVIVNQFGGQLSNGALG